MADHAGMHGQQPWLTTFMNLMAVLVDSPLLHSLPSPAGLCVPAGMLMQHWTDDRSMAYSTYKVAWGERSVLLPSLLAPSRPCVLQNLCGC